MSGETAQALLDLCHGAHFGVDILFWRFSAAVVGIGIAFGLWWLGVEYFNNQRPLLRAACIFVGLASYGAALSFVGGLI